MSFLDKIDTSEAKQKTKNPFANESKKSKPVQIRENQYNELRKIAFDEDKKLINLLEEALDDYLTKKRSPNNNG